MTITRETAMGWILNAEGGYVWDPNDPGGETNLGITWPALNRAIVDGVVAVGTTIKTLTKDQAKAIYRRYYWDVVKADSLPGPVGLVVFDSAVNQGTDKAARLLQEAVGAEVDGKIGAQTVALVHTFLAQPWSAALAQRLLVAEFLLARQFHYVRLKTAKHFLVGWTNRLRHLFAALKESK